MKEDQKVMVSYPDGKGNHVTTVAELRKKWSQETKQWRDGFFQALEVTGTANSSFGTYQLL